MTRFEAVKKRIFTDSDMDYVGICPASELDDEPKGRRPVDLLPNAKSIIIFGRRLISGSVQSKFRQLEDGIGNAFASYSAHSFVLSINQLCMKETYDICQDLENTYGCYAMPLTNNVLQAVQPEGNYVLYFADPYKAGLPVNIYKAAAAAGIGEMGWNHRIITPDAGPRVYLCGIVTSLEFEEYDKPYSGEKLCDPGSCGICSRVCPTHALSSDEAVEWSVGDIKANVGKLNVNGCAVACFGFRKSINPRTVAEIETDDPSDEELAAALQKQFDYPGMQTLDHLPMYHCDRCLIYCPVGNWKQQFADKGLTRMEGKL